MISIPELGKTPPSHMIYISGLYGQQIFSRWRFDCWETCLVDLVQRYLYLVSIIRDAWNGKYLICFPHLMHGSLNEVICSPERLWGNLSHYCLSCNDLYQFLNQKNWWILTLWFENKSEYPNSFWWMYRWRAFAELFSAALPALSVSSDLAFDWTEFSPYRCRGSLQIEKWRRILCESGSYRLSCPRYGLTQHSKLLAGNRFV